MRQEAREELGNGGTADCALSVERAEYFYPPGTSREELLALYRPVSEGGRLVDMGAAGIAAEYVPPHPTLSPGRGEGSE